MRIFFIIVCFGLLQIIIDGCCQLEPPPYGYSISINLLDKNTNRTLTPSRDSLYYPDSILLETGNPVRRYSMAVNRYDTILRSNYIYPEGSNSETLYFRYRSAKADTIVVYYHKETGKACGERFAVIKVDKAVLNGNTFCEPCNDLREPFLIRK